MKWIKRNRYIEQYEYNSCNQHGSRYKKLISKKVSAAKLIAEVNNAGDLQVLALLSHHLDTPIRYDFSTSPQTAYIEVVSNEQV